MKFLWALPALILLCCYAAPVQGVLAQPRYHYGTVHLFTDPPGVYVYCNGEYWGETGPNKPVVRDFWNTSNKVSVFLTLRKLGYKVTYFNMVLRLNEDNQLFAENNPQKVVAVMNTK